MIVKAAIATATTAVFAYVCARRHALGTSEFALLLVLLCALLAWTAGPWAGMEGFDGTSPVELSIGGAFAKIVAIPDAIRDTVMPGLDRFLAASQVQADPNDPDPKTPQVLQRSMYVPDVAKDDAAFAKLAAEYQAADKALSAMRGYDPDLYALLTTTATST